jgi:RNA polymerase sigma-70 factor (ECF subfamily)
VHLVGDRELAEDLVQETFLRALRAADSYDPRRGAPVAWLVAIARRVQVDHHRSDRARRARERTYASEQGFEVPAPEGPTGLSEPLREGLRRLSEAEREVIVLRVVLGFDGTDVARLLDITPTACSTTLHRAMTKLRKEVPGDVAA